MEVRAHDGPKGGEYFAVGDGAPYTCPGSRTTSACGWAAQSSPETYQGQPGGIGTISKLLDEWRARVALDPAMAEMYEALVALDAARGR